MGRISSFHLLLCVLVYGIAELLGIFSTGPATFGSVVYSRTMVVLSVLFFLLAARDVWKDGGGRMRRIAGIAAVICFFAGYWISLLTRYHVEVILTEGQAFLSNRDEGAAALVTRGPYARVPDFVIAGESYDPRFSDDGKRLLGLTADFLFRRKGDQAQRTIRLSLSPVPRLIGGLALRIDRFGYSPRYLLRDADGVVLDSSFVFMHLFPPGSEDSFTLMSPHVYSLRYYPFGKDAGRDPVFHLRIVRNKDMVFIGEVKLQEDARFDNGAIAIDEVRKWTKLSITRDFGIPIAAVGLLSGLLYGLLLIMTRLRMRKHM